MRGRIRGHFTEKVAPTWVLEEFCRQRKRKEHRSVRKSCVKLQRQLRKWDFEEATVGCRRRISGGYSRPGGWEAGLGPDHRFFLLAKLRGLESCRQRQTTEGFLARRQSVLPKA